MKQIKLANDTIDKNDINSLIEWLSQNDIPRLAKGDLTIELEKKFAKYINRKHSIYVNSGSSAILLSLATLKSNQKLKNNKIVVPGLSWATDLSSPIILGMDPILCDVNLNDLSVNLLVLEEIFKNEQPAVLLLVSVLGLVPDMKSIIELCSKYNVVLIEDACESLGSEYFQQKIGSFGLMSTFSFYFGHHISTIEGGMIATDDDEIYDLLLAMRSHGWDRDLPLTTAKKLQKQYQVSDFKTLYTFYYPGFNLRSTDLQAFIGIKQLDKLDLFVKIRNENFKLYQHKLKNYNRINFIDDNNHFISNMAYPIINENRDIIVEKLKQNNIEIRPLIAGDMSIQPMFTDRYDSVKLPVCDYIEKYGFYLPNHPNLTQENITLISDIIISNSK